MKTVTLGLALLTLAGCANLPRPAGPTGPWVRPTDAAGERCRVTSGEPQLLLTEWPAAEKANLEVLLQRGAVAVSYQGCSMRLLPQCELGGGYSWLRTSPASDRIEIDDEDELYAKLPLGAVSLESELKRWGKLSVETRVSGQLRLGGLQPTDIPRSGECAYATHVIGALSVGAFTMSSGGGYQAGGGAGVGLPGGEVVSAGGKMTRGAGRGARGGRGRQLRQLDRRGATPELSLSDPGVPLADPGSRRGVGASGHGAGRSPLRARRQPLGRVRRRRGRSAPPPAPAGSSRRGRCSSARATTARTPCRIGSSSPGSVPRRRAAPSSSGPTRRRRASSRPGIVFSTFGGMGVMTGITFSAIGCSSSDRPGFCTAGLISLGAGALVTAGSIFLILDSMPRAEVVPLYELGPARSTIALTAIGPGYLAGTF